MATPSTKTKKTSSLQLRTKLKAGCTGTNCGLGLGNHHATLVDRSKPAPAKSRRLQVRTMVKAGCVGAGCTVGGIGNHNETLVDRSRR